MAPEEAQQGAPRRRGRPPGSKNKTGRARAAGGDLVGQLNAMVAELIKKNRQLQRQVTKLSEERRSSSETKGVERSLRTMSLKVRRALGTKTTRSARKAAPANGRRRKSTTRRRRAT